MTDEELFKKALDFATVKHEGQMRGDKIRPYIVHPKGVAELLLKARVTDIKVLCAALLHDTLEDTETSFEELIENFGVRIAGIVIEVTDDPSLSKTQQKASQIARAHSLSFEAKLVKLADKIYNVRDLRVNPPTWKNESQLGYLQGCREVVDRMAMAEPAGPHRNPHFGSLLTSFYEEYEMTKADILSRP